MTNEIVELHKENTQLDILNTDSFDTNFFINNYKFFISKYTSKGRPSPITMKEYGYAIDAFLLWCNENLHDPMVFTDYQIRLYLDFLRGNGLSEVTIAQKIAALKAFYNTAVKMNFIPNNPANDVGAAVTVRSDNLFHYYSTEELEEIMNALDKIADGNDLLIVRNRLILYLMGVEGMRNIEVQRANWQDIDWDNGVIMVRGKGTVGRIDPIYPCSDTMELLYKYREAADLIPIKKTGALTPLIISVSGKNKYGRISGNGLRFIMNEALKLAGLKKAGASCHVLRHSCGTNLYANTKDLRLVQETLRQRNPAIAARYAHVQDRLTNRRTANITPGSHKTDK